MLMLKSFLFVGIFWVSSFGLAQEIKWVSLEKAVELQKKQPKKIIMDMYTAWCGPCKMLDKNTPVTIPVERSQEIANIN
jgi:thiol:disulfide interchange protein